VNPWYSVKKVLPDRKMAQANPLSLRERARVRETAGK
jgi:hypothetical protein